MLNNRKPIKNQIVFDIIIIGVIFLLTYVVITNK